MRTTLDLDDELLRGAKKAAAARGISLRRVVEEGLALVLAGPKSSPRAKRLRWKVTRGAALPGVDFADRDRLYETMEGRG